jgi:hypothetical protein
LSLSFDPDCSSKVSIQVAFKALNFPLFKEDFRPWQAVFRSSRIDLEHLQSGRRDQAVVETYDGRAGNVFFGCHDHCRQLQGVGGLQGVHLEQSQGSFLDLAE